MTQQRQPFEHTYPSGYTKTIHPGARLHGQTYDEWWEGAILLAQSRGEWPVDISDHLFAS